MFNWSGRMKNPLLDIMYCTIYNSFTNLLDIPYSYETKKAGPLGSDTVYTASTYTNPH
jgi:hypothetical protein